MFDLFGAFRLFLRKVERIFITPISLFIRMILRKLNPQNIVSKVATDIKKEAKGITGKPTDLSQYFVVGEKFIAKKLVYAVIILLILLAILFVKFGMPLIVSWWFTKDMWINSEEVSGYTGKVRLYDTSKLDVLIFEGRLENGIVMGDGTLYNYDGELVYTGNFENGEYSGYGKLYYPNGNVEYAGSFSANIFEGDGTRYFNSGATMYTGQFQSGMFNGAGKLYDEESGGMLYDGTFEKGVYNGIGKEYSAKTGAILYNGNFVNNEYSGKGDLYDAETGKLIYSGDFRSDIYSGTGKLYSDGILIYDGSFSNGVYNGYGTEMDETGIRYVGDFVNGKYNGQGKLYENGTLVYSGGFTARECCIKTAYSFTAVVFLWENRSAPEHFMMKRAQFFPTVRSVTAMWWTVRPRYSRITEICCMSEVLPTVSITARVCFMTAILVI